MNEKNKYLHFRDYDIIIPLLIDVYDNKLFQHNYVYFCIFT